MPRKLDALEKLAKMLGWLEPDTNQHEVVNPLTQLLINIRNRNAETSRVAQKLSRDEVMNRLPAAPDAALSRRVSQPFGDRRGSPSAGG